MNRVSFGGGGTGAEVVLATYKNRKICYYSDILHYKFEKSLAFTLPEVLITLGIIGGVAALTLPTLISNYRNKVLAVQTRKTYSIINQAGGFTMTTITKLPHDHGQNIEQKLKDMPNVDKFQTVADIFKQ